MGVYGLGNFIQGNQFLINLIAIIGIIFLVFYALLSFKSVFNTQSISLDDRVNKNSLKEIILMLLVFTFLNPHTYLDTVLLIGGVGANIQDSLKQYFLIGAVCASSVWFISLGYGARFLIPYFKKPITWKILDVFIGFIMLLIAYLLLDLLRW
jgi:L-lysine exporter family protein LysE/ArgO